MSTSYKAFILSISWIIWVAFVGGIIQTNSAMMMMKAVVEIGSLKDIWWFYDTIESTKDSIGKIINAFIATEMTSIHCLLLFYFEAKSVYLIFDTRKICWENYISLKLFSNSLDDFKFLLRSIFLVSTAALNIFFYIGVHYSCRSHFFKSWAAIFDCRYFKK